MTERLPVSLRRPGCPRRHARLPRTISVAMIRRIAFAVGDTAGHVMPALAIAEAYDALRAGTATSGFSRRLAAPPRGWQPRRDVSRDRVCVRTCPRRTVGPHRRVGPCRPRHSRRAASLAKDRHTTRDRHGRLRVWCGAARGAQSWTRHRRRRAQRRAGPGQQASETVGGSRVCQLRGQRSVLLASKGPHPRHACESRPGRRFQTARVAPPPDGPIHVLVTGASRGEHFLGAEIPALLGGVQRLGVALQVRHQSGSLDAAMLEREYERHSVRATVVGLPRRHA